MNFLHGPALSAAIRDILNQKRADIAVAFWGKGACERLAIPPNARGSRVACDARSGACNPSAISDLMERNVAIVDVPGLHAKVYIGEKGAVISSANASANGLGEEGDELLAGLEVGYLTTRQKDLELARRWFDDLYSHGYPITEGDLPELRELWGRRPLHRPSRRPMTATYPAALLAPVEEQWITRALEAFHNGRKKKIYFGTNSNQVETVPPLIETVLFKPTGTTLVTAVATYIDITDTFPQLDERLDGVVNEIYRHYYSFNDLKELPEPKRLSSLSYYWTGNAVPNSVPGCCFVTS
jgi:hypothetical protein